VKSKKRNEGEMFKDGGKYDEIKNDISQMILQNVCFCPIIGIKINIV